MEKYVRDKNVLADDKEKQISDYNSHDGQGIRDREDSEAKKRGLEIKEKNEDLLFVTDKVGPEISSSRSPKSSNTTNASGDTSSGRNHVIKSEASHYNVTISSNNQMNKTYHSTAKSIINSSQLRQETQHSSQTKDSMIEYRKRLFSAHSTCSGPSDSLSERRGDILYE